MTETPCICPFDAASEAVPIYVTTGERIDSLSDAQNAWLTAHGFRGKSGEIVRVPDTDGSVLAVVCGYKEGDVWALAGLPAALKAGLYRLEGLALTTELLTGWVLGFYKFDIYKENKATSEAVLMLPEEFDADEATETAAAVALVRTLVNTPTEDMGPTQLQDSAEEIAEAFDARCRTIVGDDLLDENFPAIHTVGRAAATGREPRLIDLTWGREDAPKLTLVGKGVCFDTGGLDLKPSQFMRLMKKDMGGAAHVLGLARLIMATGLDVRLRVLVSAVENAVSGNAFRPGDILNTRKGLTVEVGNTDAEGRLVLCDALALACEETPDLLIDFATLTGAARVALGADLPATFTNDEGVWQALDKASGQVSDLIWRLPLYEGYDASLESDIADLSNMAEGGYGGAITAALYLQRFVGKDIPWVHIDVFSWNQKPRSGRPKGGEAQSLRAVFRMIRDRFGGR